MQVGKMPFILKRKGRKIPALVIKGLCKWGTYGVCMTGQVWERKAGGARFPKAASEGARVSILKHPKTSQPAQVPLVQEQQEGKGRAPQQPCSQAQGCPRETPASCSQQRCLAPSGLPGEMSVGDGSFHTSSSGTSVPMQFLNCQEGARAATTGLGGFPVPSWSLCAPLATWGWAHGHSSSPASWPVGSAAPK